MASAKANASAFFPLATSAEADDEMTDLFELSDMGV